MGLQEKRVIKAFQEGKFVEFKKKIEELAGDKTEIEIHWDTLAVDNTANYLEAGLEKIYFTSTIGAFEEIAVDNLGKEALESELNKIVITNSGSNFSPRGAYNFGEGVLTIDHKPDVNHNDIDERKKYLANYLMNNF